MCCAHHVLVACPIYIILHIIIAITATLYAHLDFIASFASSSTDLYTLFRLIWAYLGSTICMKVMKSVIRCERFPRCQGSFFHAHNFAMALTYS